MTSLPPLDTAGVGHRRFKHRRSRNGCLTCKRRKVRCNEQRPQCCHCQRLNLDCVWKDITQRQSPSKNAAMGSSPESNETAFQVDGPSPSGALFDFAQSVMDPPEDFSLFQDIYLPDLGDFTVPGHGMHERVLSTDLEALNSPHVPPRSPPRSPTGDVDVDASLPLHVPPILDPVESGPKGASVRALFDSMAASSPMVRYSIAAFAAIQYCAPKKKADYQQYYDKAAKELSEKSHKPGRDTTVNRNELRYVLTTIFFLTYINVCSLIYVNFSALLTCGKLLTGRLDLAYLNLAKAHNALQASESGSLDSTGRSRNFTTLMLLLTATKNKESSHGYAY